MAKPIDKWTCRVPGCGKPVPWTDWTTCEAHNTWAEALKSTRADAIDARVDTKESAHE